MPLHPPPPQQMLHLDSTPSFTVPNPSFPSQVLHHVTPGFTVPLTGSTLCQYTWHHCPPIPPGAAPCRYTWLHCPPIPPGVTPCQYTWLHRPPIPPGATPCQLHLVSTPGFTAFPSPQVLPLVNYTLSVHLASLPPHPPRCYTLSVHLVSLPSHPPRCYTLSTTPCQYTWLHCPPIPPGATPCQYTWLHCPPIPPGATPCQLHLVSTPGFTALPSPQVLHLVNYTLSVHLASLSPHRLRRLVAIWSWRAPLTSWPDWTESWTTPSSQPCLGASIRYLGKQPSRPPPSWELPPRRWGPPWPSC